MIQRIIIFADNGKILTNGEIFGKEIYLAENETPDGFYEISEEEYQIIQENLESENI